MSEYIRSLNIYRATALFTFTVLACHKTPFGRARCHGSLLIRSRIVVPIYRDFDSELNIKSEPGSNYTWRVKIREIMP